MLVNARILTQDAGTPTAQSLAVRGDRIIWVGNDPDSRAFDPAGARVVNCGGGTLIPGFHDAHMHLLSYASTFGAVDCRPGQASSIPDIGRQIARKAARTPRGGWVSGWGYDPFHLDEGRHPTRWDLDHAAPEHPVRLDHRSGHACVLNSLAMERVGIAENTDEPAGTTIARDLETGIPNGLLLEMQDTLDQRMPKPSFGDLASLVDRAASRLLSLGVTSVQDATHSNSPRRWDLLQDLSGRGRPLPRVTMMPGAVHIREFVNAGMRFGSGNDSLRIGHAKILVTASSGSPSLSHGDLESEVDACTSRGFPVAVHAVESHVVHTVAEVLAESQMTSEQRPVHRIEHCSEAPPDVMEVVARSGAAIVTQPGFIHHQGDRYIAEVHPSMQPYLYRAASLASRGVRVAFSSDAPVVDPDPMPALHAAVTRRTSSGNALGAGEKMDCISALSSYTIEPARLTGIDDRIGRLAPGSLADLVLFDEDLTTVEPDSLLGIRPVMTILGGQVVWES